MSEEPAIMEHIIAAQRAACEGKKPHEILVLLLSRIKPTYPEVTGIIPVEHCMRIAFDIPLRDIRDIESWEGFSERGTLSNQDIDVLLEPWVIHYRNSA